MVVVEEEDWFVLEQKEEERLAEERRQRRKRKLAQYNNTNTNITTQNEADVQPKVVEEVVQVNTRNENDKTEEKEDGNDSFDMFSSSPIPTKNDTTSTTTTTTVTGDVAVVMMEQQETRNKDDVANFDDEEGYYKAHIGQTLTMTNNSEYKVMGIIGKGVFSTVLKCKDQTHQQQQVVAMKVIRNKEPMAKAALNIEIPLLQKLVGKHHLVQYIHHVHDYHGHVAIVLQYQPFTLRHVLNKFGGIAFLAVKSYFYQLLQALKQLQQLHIVHADIKPDNILLSESYSTLYLADFGSAYIHTNNNNNNSPPTPYLVSRFYRAPEIIMGIHHHPTTSSSHECVVHQLDLWSVAITVAELFCGSVLIPGTSNNDMLYRMMSIFQKPFPKTMIRRHLSNLQPQPQYHFASQPPHFFQHVRIDKVSGQNVMDIIPHVPTSNQNNKEFHQLIMSAKSPKDDYGQVIQLIQLLQTCFTFDPTKRITIQQALSHPFFTTTTTTQTTTTTK